jgi:predicted  nucleic acid-binding Zn-ribbon protein
VDKIKAVFGSIWAIVVAILGLIIAILTLGMLQKNNKINSLSARLATATTKEQVDALEKEVVVLNTKKQLTEQEVVELNLALEDLAKKKIELRDNQQSTTVKDNLDYWNN